MATAVLNAKPEPALSVKDEDTATITIARDEAGAPSIGTYTGPGAATAVPFVFVTTDRGDVIELLDASGEPFALYAYGAYGDPTSAMSTGTALVDADLAERICELQPLRYAGYVYDGHSGLYQCNARYYDPSTARFLSKDPVRADGEMSGWMYCGGDPVGCVDPSGLHQSILGTHHHSFNLESDIWWSPRRVVRVLYTGPWRDHTHKPGWEFRIQKVLYRRHVGAHTWALKTLSAASLVSDLMTLSVRRIVFGYMGGLAVGHVYKRRVDGRSGFSFYTIYYNGYRSEYRREQ